MKPTSDATTQRKKANEAYKNAQLGLKIVSPSAARSVVGDVVMKSARGEWRPSDSDSYHSLLVSSTALVDDLSRRVVATNTAISTEERKIGRFRLACGKEGYGAAVTAMSAFESLQALSNGNAEATSCCICLDVLGSNAGDATGAADTAFIAMTKCGVSIPALFSFDCTSFAVSEVSPSYGFLSSFPNKSTCIAEAAWKIAFKLQTTCVLNVQPVAKKSMHLVMWFTSIHRRKTRVLVRLPVRMRKTRF